MELETALESLMSLFTTELCELVSAKVQKLIKKKVNDWMSSQPTFIQSLFSDTATTA